MLSWDLQFPHFESCFSSLGFGWVWVQVERPVNECRDCCGDSSLPHIRQQSAGANVTRGANFCSQAKHTLGMVAGRNVRAATVWCETNARIGENLSEHRFPNCSSGCLVEKYGHTCTFLCAHHSQMNMILFHHKFSDAETWKLREIWTNFLWHPSFGEVNSEAFAILECLISYGRMPLHSKILPLFQTVGQFGKVRYNYIFRFIKTT